MNWTPRCPWLPQLGEDLTRYISPNPHKVRAAVEEVTLDLFRVVVRHAMHHNVATYRKSLWAGLTQEGRELWLYRDLATLTDSVLEAHEKLMKRMQAVNSPSAK